MNANPILIVEDEADLLALFQVMLRRRTYPNPIITALGGKEALEVLNTEAPAVVLLDLAMPGVSGNDVIAYILANEQLSRTQIVVVTAVPMRLDEELAPRISAMLIKPVAPHDLDNAVAQALADFEAADGGEE